MDLVFKQSLGGLLKNADRHHFGQRVRPTERASVFYFHKPRTVFWENLFFGRQSPLRPIFEVPTSNGGLRLSQTFFNLEIEEEGEWSGFSRELVPSTAPKGLTHFAGFGALLGYAYVFGIRDLHAANLVLGADGLRVIDAEVVLTNLTLPQETLLLPFKECGGDECGFSLLAENVSLISEDQKRAVLAGFIDVLEVFHRNLTLFRDVFSAITRFHPIRVLLRNTREYSFYFRDGVERRAKDFPVLPEELVQLRRDDVPYFFKRLDSNQVYWVKGITASGPMIEVVKSMPATMIADVARHAVDPHVLLESPSLIEKRLVHGLMFLHRKLQLEGAAHFAWCGGRLDLSSQGLEIEALRRKFVLPI